MNQRKDAATMTINDAASEWQQRCLLGGGSVFTEESLWNGENFEHLKTYFIDNLDEGEGSFYEKLKQQLAPAPLEAKRLWAEMTWVLWLIVNRGVIKPETRRDRIRQIWEWSGSVLPDDHWALGEVLEKGVADPGQGYLSHWWRECRFFITAMMSWFSLPLENRESLLTDPWDFAKWLDAQEDSQRRQFRSALLFLLFPADFETIMSLGDKEKIVKAFFQKWSWDLSTNMDRTAWDRALKRIVEKLHVEYPDREDDSYSGKKFEFYDQPFVDVWQGGGPPPPSPPPPPPLPPPVFYSIDSILAEGCFLERDKLDAILQRLRDKKNLILQGPPGTGKTWLAKKLAFALMGERAEDKIRPVQFHPNLAYEDFVRGWRPSGNGTLDLVDGPFLQMINTAKGDPESKYAIIIEEINRGNPAQIFGEMLTLLESDKRDAAEALALSYGRGGERIYIPENLYVIGTMNVADRSIAMVDFALRRRFAFVDLEPIFGRVWREWVHEHCNIDEGFLSQVEERMNALNDQIAEDDSLGVQFKIGHSYVTPAAGHEIDDPNEWFNQVVETEIGPLLDEYWFDAPDTAREAKEQLLEGL